MDGKNDSYIVFTLFVRVVCLCHSQEVWKKKFWEELMFFDTTGST
jgi:hypothetical protein